MRNQVTTSSAAIPKDLQTNGIAATKATAATAFGLAAGFVAGFALGWASELVVPASASFEESQGYAHLSP